jgi:phosphate binding protein
VKRVEDSLRAGDVIDGKYRVVRVLGRGGMGIVVEAIHLRLGASVALKVLAGRSDRGDGSKRKPFEALVREAQVAARLRSEHVARVFDVGALGDGSPFVVMEHLSGVTLHEEIYGVQSPMPIARAVEIVLQASDAVAEAHQLGIVHRDLKPANLFLARSPNGRETVKVLDFGIAKMLSEAREPVAPLSEATDTGEFSFATALAGTPQYMAPEHFERQPVISPSGDVWALGVILYELLSGRRPYESKQLLELIWRVTSTPPASPREHRPEIPTELDRIVLRCLARDRAVRYARVDDLMLDLRAFANAGDVPPAPITMPSFPPVETAMRLASPRPRRARIAVAAIAASVVAVGAVTIGAGILHRGRPRAPVAAAMPAPPPPTAASVVVMSGSSTVAELGTHWSSAFGASRKDVELRVEPTSTAAGLGALARREVDLVGASRYATDDEIALARANGVELEPHVVAHDGLAVIVHPDNRVDALSIEQLRGILTGRIKTWSGVGGAKGAIHLLARPEDQGSSEILRHLVLREGDTVADNVEVIRKTDDAIARVLRDPNAVSFVTFRDVGASKALKLKSAGALIGPSTQTIRSQRYPLRRDLLVYTRRDARPQANDIVSFLEGPGKHVVAESGFVPP